MTIRLQAETCLPVLRAAALVLLVTCSYVVVQDEERTKVGLNEVPSVDQVNIMMARSPEELELFRRLDHELDWPQAAHGEPAAECCRRCQGMSTATAPQRKRIAFSAFPGKAAASPRTRLKSGSYRAAD